MPRITRVAPKGKAEGRHRGFGGGGRQDHLSTQLVVAQGDLPDPLHRITGDLSYLPGELPQGKQPDDLVVGALDRIASFAVAILQLLGGQMVFEA